MADEKTAPATPAPSSRKSTILLVVVAAALAIAIVVVAVMQSRSAKALQGAAEALRQDLAQLRQDTDAKDRLLTDLTAKIQADVAKITESTQALTEAGTRTQEEITNLRTEIATIRVKAGIPAAGPGQESPKAELSSAVQQEIADQLNCLGERIEKLKTEVILKETKILQDQITDTKGRIDQAEKDVSTLKQALKEADIPSLKAKVSEVDRQVMQAEADVKALTKAADAFKAQVTGFFQEVFYNDPWGKYLVPPKSAGQR
jgi:chromosome segregation ATPase